MNETLYFTCRRPELEPCRGNDHAAGIDLRADLYAEHQVDGLTVGAHTDEADLSPANAGKRKGHITIHEMAIIRTGVSVAIPDGFFGMVAIRSSVAFKRGLALINSTGIIDCDYRGEILVGLVRSREWTHHTQQGAIIEHGERIAQLLILPVAMMPPVQVKSLPRTERGEEGFGSTGRH